MKTHGIASLVTLLLTPCLGLAPGCGTAPAPPWTPRAAIALPDPQARPAPVPPEKAARTCRDWSEVRGGPRRHGRSFCPGLRTAPRVVWRAHTGGAVVGVPIVSGPSVYVGNLRGRVVALNRRTGKARWTLETGSPVRGAVAVAGGRLYVGTADGQLHCVHERTGRVLWKRALAHRIDRAPAVHGTVVAVGTADGRLTGLDASTGRLRWRYATATLARRSQKGTYTVAGIGGTPAAANGTLYFGGLGGHMHALAASTGQLRWSVRLGERVRSTPLLSRRAVWVTDASGYIHRLSPINGERSTGMRSWYRKDVSSPTLGDRAVYVATDHALLAVKPTGYLRWAYKLGYQPHVTPRNDHPAPVLAEGVVYLSDRQGYLHAVDARSGQRLWRRRARRGAHSPPAPVAEGLFVGSGDGAVYLLSSSSSR